MASGKIGRGRFPDTGVIIGTIEKVLGQNGDLAGKCFVVTAGGTQGPVDPVRPSLTAPPAIFGYAVAEAAPGPGGICSSHRRT